MSSSRLTYMLTMSWGPSHHTNKTHETYCVMHCNHAQDTDPLCSTKGRKVWPCVHACVCLYLCVQSERETRVKKATRGTGLAFLKQLLLSTKTGVYNDEHPGCSFHIEEIAFGNIALAGMMKYTAPPPHTHTRAHIFCIVPRISNIQKIIFTKVKAVRTRRTRT